MSGMGIALSATLPPLHITADEGETIGVGGIDPTVITATPTQPTPGV